MNLSRRDILRYAALGTAAMAAGRVATSATASAAPRVRLLDYAGGVPSAAAIKRAGFQGAVRYVSARRPGAEWMKAKPLLVTESRRLQAAGLEIVSCYQFGKDATADWKGGAESGRLHSELGMQLHVGAGGPRGVPIYACIDDNPTRKQFTDQIAPYLRAWAGHMNSQGMKLGVYGNHNVVEWCRQEHIGTHFWMHDWGSGGRIHPATNIHQLPVRQGTRVDGIECDINDVMKSEYGQWSAAGGVQDPGATAPAPGAPAPGKPGKKPSDFGLPGLEGIPDPERFLDLLQTLLRTLS